MTERAKAYWVGALFFAALILLCLFLWLMGAVGPFGRQLHYSVLYDFAGGVEVGSPVRVAGIKVGKVDSIRFVSPSPTEVATVSVGISVDPSAANHVRTDSKFFVNMAGIIGEKYVEISPGSEAAPPLASGAMVRGVDPPRIDQLLSQGYGVFGRIQDFLNDNEKVITEFLANMTHLLADANKLLKTDERHRITSLVESLVDLFQKENTTKFLALVDNLNKVSGDMKHLTSGLQTEEAKKMYQELLDLVERAHAIDKQSLKKFLQEEGIKARMF